MQFYTVTFERPAEVTQVSLYATDGAAAQASAEAVYFADRPRDLPDLTIRMERADRAAVEPYEVLVVLDPEFGHSLNDWWPGRPVWIVSSAVNDPIIAALRAKAPNHNHLTGLTVLTHYFDQGRESCFLECLDTIDLHHGPMSADPPYTIIRVIGAPLSPAIRSGLNQYGFTTFEEGAEGFAAFRTLADAARIRD